MEATASDPSVQAAGRDARRHPERGPGERAVDVEHPGERSVTCKGEFDKAPGSTPASCGRAEGLRGVQEAPRRVRAGDGARHAVWPNSTRRRCRCTASRFRSRIRSTRRTCARPAAPTRATTSTSRRATTRSRRAAPQQGRDHLRQGRAPPSTTAVQATRAVARKTRC